MAYRTTAAAVAKIVEADPDIDLDPFIETANSVTTNICATAALGYPDATLELIERWLAAHFYRIRDQAAAQEAAGTVSETLQFKLGLFLQTTMWGQQAMIVDYKGALAQFDKRLQNGTSTPGILWLGTRRRSYECD